MNTSNVNHNRLVLKAAMILSAVVGVNALAAYDASLDQKCGPVMRNTLS